VARKEEQEAMRIGSAALLVTFLGGIWLMVAPSLTGIPHPAGNPWPTPVLLDVLFGAFTSLVSLVGLVAFAGMTLGRLQCEAPRAQESGENR
jgi:predicted cobalt transporter CbtA